MPKERFAEGRRRQAVLQSTDRDLGNRRLAGGFLAVAERLGQESPQHDRRRVDGVGPEKVAVLGEHAFDAVGRKNIGERQPVPCQKRSDDPLKAAIATVPTTCYPKNPPWFLLSDRAKEGVPKLARDGPKTKSNPHVPEG